MPQTGDLGESELPESVDLLQETLAEALTPY